MDSPYLGCPRWSNWHCKITTCSRCWCWSEGYCKYKNVNVHMRVCVSSTIILYYKWRQPLHYSRIYTKNMMKSLSKIMQLLSFLFLTIKPFVLILFFLYLKTSTTNMSLFFFWLFLFYFLQSSLCIACLNCILLLNIIASSVIGHITSTLCSISVYFLLSLCCKYYLL